MSSLKEELETDQIYIRFKNTVKQNSLEETMKNLVSEVESMHRTRKMRKLVSKSPNPRDVVEAALEDAACRSRCVEILIQVTRAQRIIENALDTVCAYILHEYKDWIEHVSTKADRNKYVRNVVNKRALQYLQQLEIASETIKFVVEDLDKAGFSMKHAIEAIKIIYARESVIPTNI